MSLKIEQVDHRRHKWGSLTSKWLKKQRNRKIRRYKKDEVPHIKYRGWE